MPSLENLRKKLYGAKEPQERRREPLFEYRKKAGGTAKHSWSGEDLEALHQARSGEKKSKWLANLFIFALVIFLGVAAYVGYEIFFVREEIQITIAGPEGVEIGARADFAVFIKNIGRVGFSDVELTVTYPPHSVPLDDAGAEKKAPYGKIAFGVLRPGEERKQEIAIRFFGKTGTAAPLSVFAVYRPENIASRLTKKAEYAVLLTRSPFVIDMESPELVSNDQELQMRVNLRSGAEIAIEEAAFRMRYPDGFTFVAADPVPGQEDNFWSIGSFSPGETRTITIRGRLRGEPKEAKTFAAELGRYSPAANEWVPFLEEVRGLEIASPLLFIRQDVNGRRGGTLNAGDNLGVEIFYKNNLSHEAQDVVIAARLSEDVLSMATLRIEGGAYDPGAREIRWTPASLPELKRLAPGAEGRVRFGVGLRSSPPLREASDRNFSFTSNAKIDAGGSAEDFRGAALSFEDHVAIPINTRLTLTAGAAYFDSPTANTGPLPPQAGKETTYTIFWRLANQSNDVTQVTVKGGLPPNVKWIGAIGEFSGTVAFNPASSEVAWNIPRVASATGILRPQAVLMFRVLLTPGENQVGTTPPLVLNISADGIDAFTNERLHDETEQITTELSADTTRNSEHWRVVQ